MTSNADLRFCHRSSAAQPFEAARFCPAIHFAAFGREHGAPDALPVTQFFDVILFGGMDSALYADFKQGGQAQIAVSDRQLKHAEGWVSHAHMAIRGPLVEVSKQDGEVPPGSSRIQIRLKVDLVLEGFRPGNVVRIRPMNWSDDSVPREEYTAGNREERFPSHQIFFQNTDLGIWSPIRTSAYTLTGIFVCPMVDSLKDSRG